MNDTQTHYQKVAKEIASFFGTQKRGEETITVLKGEPEWMEDFMHQVHEAVDGSSPRLPDDWIYNQTVAVISNLGDREGEGEEDFHEIADGLVEIYTTELIDWLKDAHNRALLEYVKEEGLVNDDTPLERQIMAAQYEGISRILRFVHEFIVARVEEVEE